MAAVTYALVGLCVLLATTASALAIWCHSLISDVRSAAEYRRDRDLQAVELASVRKALALEQSLRTIAESQRNEAMRRTRDLLAQHAKDMTDDEIREMVRAAFASPLVVVPTLSAADDRDDLLNPFTPVRDA